MDGLKHGDPSVRLAEHEREGHNEELIALIVADMQDPIAPILEVPLVGKGFYDIGRVFTRFSEVAYRGAAMIDENLFRVGGVEI
jgi:hypothetical protein